MNDPSSNATSPLLPFFLIVVGQAKNKNCVVMIDTVAGGGTYSFVDERFRIAVRAIKSDMCLSNIVLCCSLTFDAVSLDLTHDCIAFTADSFALASARTFRCSAAFCAAFSGASGSVTVFFVPLTTTVDATGLGVGFTLAPPSTSREDATAACSSFCRRSNSFRFRASFASFSRLARMRLALASSALFFAGLPASSSVNIVSMP
mmetsp:Transcript_21165/g.35889  ORF Transcript_21165/g.35889 Transcript_21165/m.35889 type:complete len:204 (-) Transcript_21165:26-637(-)